MGRPPAYVFVVRHGSRLDAADKQWHLTSPSPYDPPLTYGGWMHSRNVGARIASILREDSVAAAPASANTPPGSESGSPPPPSPSPPSSTTPPSSSTKKRRSFRIVIHSSPFLRCIQTSIAISAGLASNPISSPSDQGKHANPATPSQSRPGTSQSTDDSSRSGAAASPHNAAYNSPAPIQKSVLRLDAFLGEWMSPDYFEFITPPPKSALMLATAKAELLRRSSYHDYPNFHVRQHTNALGQLWNNSPSRNRATGAPSLNGSHAPSNFDTMPLLADSLSKTEPNSTSLRDAPAISQENSRAQGYVYPVPAYAISPSEPIPRGYVAHARDACVSVDYQWDSSRDNLGWGDGGQIPEEWASMHLRFRGGLWQLIHWYSSTENPAEMVTKTAHRSQPTQPTQPDHAAEDIEIEDVVILVSHGAGCNALIGALIHQPVLTNVPLSSLTMATRRPNFDYRTASLTRETSASSLDAVLPSSNATIPDIYELGLFANTDHLVSPSPAAFHRNTSDTNTNTNTHARTDSASSSVLGESFPGLPHMGSPPGSRGPSTNASLGSMRRPTRTSLVIRPSVFNSNTGGITVGSGVSSFATTRSDRSGSGTWGLWSPKPRDDEPGQESEPFMFLDFSHEKLAAKKAEENRQKDEGCSKLLSTAESCSAATTTSKVESQGTASENNHGEEEHDKFGEDTLPPLRPGTSNGGLWGSPRPPGEAERSRDFSASKRRWTVTDR
ncbi:hypothetical protein GGR50DRAFT_224027 [Xylaria sp. CBS 124048]|nr:hypothetical protein GGR50DRAFT_224027 [Xylaria sp. CBS 124048]